MRARHGRRPTDQQSPADLSVHQRAGVCAMTSPPESMKDPLLDCLYHGLLRLASLPRSKRAYGVHLEFFDGYNRLAVKAYVDCPHPSLGAVFFIALCSKDLRRDSRPQLGGRADRPARYFPDAVPFLRSLQVHSLPQARASPVAVAPTFSKTRPSARMSKGFLISGTRATPSSVHFKHKISRIRRASS
jgi:hypothetical protein